MGFLQMVQVKHLGCQLLFNAIITLPLTSCPQAQHKGVVDVDAVANGSDEEDTSATFDVPD